MAFGQNRNATHALGAEFMGVNVQQRCTTFVYAIAKCLLDAMFVIQSMAIADLDNKMCASKHFSVAADKVIIARFIKHITIGNRCRGHTAGGVFLMGACLQTDPQLEEVGVIHSAPLRSSRLASPVGSLAPPQRHLRLGSVPKVGRHLAK